MRARFMAGDQSLHIMMCPPPLTYYVYIQPRVDRMSECRFVSKGNDLQQPAAERAICLRTTLKHILQGRRSLLHASSSQAVVHEKQKLLVPPKFIPCSLSPPL